MNKRSISELLNTVIPSSLFGPCGDPTEPNLRAAANAFVALRELGLPIKFKDEVERTLRTDNICDEDFLAPHD